MRYRSFIFPAAGLALVIGGFLAFSLNDSLVYFHTPTELLGRDAPASDRVRLGGQVAEGTVASDGQTVAFEVTDGVEAVPVIHRGAPQQLFREGIGVVVEGTWAEGVFHSDTMIIRHDEQYRTRDGEPYDTPAGSEAAP